MNLYPGPPATLGITAAAGARIVVWCRACRHRVEPDPVALAARYGADCSRLAQAADMLALRRALAKIDETVGVQWWQAHLDYCVRPLLDEPWVLDVDATIKRPASRRWSAMAGMKEPASTTTMRGV